MHYKPDWDQAKKRLELFWSDERGIVDRCCMAVFAPRKTSREPPFPELQWGPWLGGLEKFADDDAENIGKWWTDPEQNYRRMLHWFENTYFGGEAVPCTYTNWGASALAGFYGSPVAFTRQSVWFKECIGDWKTWEWKFSRAENVYYRQTRAIVEKLVAECGGRYFVGIPEFGDAADVLSLMRGMDNLSMDLYDCGDEVKRAVEVLSDSWIDLHEEFFRLVSPCNDGGGVLAWMSLWAPGRHTQVACDFASVLSPGMFGEFFVPEVKKLLSWCEYGTFHLDGPDCMRNHLDALLAIQDVDNIEWTPGAGSPPTFYEPYIPRYKSILEAGKRLYLLTRPDEVKPILDNLPAGGLFLCTWADSEDAADRMLDDAARWSR
ncbi:MAG: hypothetical protein LBT97_11500 [Planctomycetota bacterium]|jgi:hypothetical protein|nr:hypothetical protein [Planctomycetota bacterium]